MAPSAPAEFRPPSTVAEWREQYVAAHTSWEDARLQVGNLRAFHATQRASAFQSALAAGHSPSAAETAARHATASDFGDLCDAEAVMDVYRARLDALSILLPFIPD